MFIDRYSNTLQRSAIESKNFEFCTVNYRLVSEFSFNIFVFRNVSQAHFIN
jgi:hypothetical protein